MVVQLREELEDRFIDEQTIRPDWHGETMDNDLAVGHLWDIEYPRSIPQESATAGPLPEQALNIGH